MDIIRLALAMIVIISFFVFCISEIKRAIRLIESETYCSCLFRDNDVRVKKAKERIKFYKETIILFSVSMGLFIGLIGYVVAILINHF